MENIRIIVLLYFLLGTLSSCDNLTSLRSKEKRSKSTRFVLEGIDAVESRNWPKAEINFNEAIKIDPTNAEAFLERGKYKQTGKGRWQNSDQDYNGALRDFNKAINLDTNYVEAYLERAKIKEIRMKDYRGALEDYTKASKVDPKNADIYLAIGDFKFDIDSNYQDALNYYTKSISLNPNKGNYYTKRSLTWLKLNDKNKFCEDYQKAMRLADREAQQFSNYKEIGEWIKDCK
jgi:tetratricopeptide (TPR) repeat protein